MKAYTDLEQSKRLAEILPMESADMVLLHEEPYETSDSKFDGLHQALCVPFNKYDKSWRQKYKNISYFPCWSLAALLRFLPFHIISKNERYGFDMGKGLNRNGETYMIRYNIFSTDICLYKTDYYNNPVNAAYEMILKLHEQKLL